MEAKLTRLERLVGTDAGFYLLALHTFVEQYVREVTDLAEDSDLDLVIKAFGDQLGESPGRDGHHRMVCLNTIARQRRFTGGLRRVFDEFDPEEAVAGTHLFLSFCALAGIGEAPALQALHRFRESWAGRRSLAGVVGVLSTLQADVTDAQKQRTHGLTSDPGRYVRSLGRLCVYTRARMDYERSSMRLTPEQEEAVLAIDREADFLVRGSAGTGKSLILIEALQRSLEVGEFRFDSGPDRRAVLLTYTRTLAKFEDYMTSAVGAERVHGLVMTVDAFILERLKRIDGDYRFDFGAMETLAAELNTTRFFTDAELATEIEIFLFGNFITHEEYTGEVVPRLGMRRRLSRGQREAVWEIRQKIVERMAGTGAFSRNYARIRILDYLASVSEDAAAHLRDVRTIYLDETQDLTAGDLITLKSLTSGYLIMASDLQQSIYGVSSPFVRAGLRISGRAKVLHTNFRNTRQVHELAERFRDMDRTRATDDAQLSAFREGPPPELYIAEDRARLLGMLVSKLRLFLDDLAHMPGDICILAPNAGELAEISGALRQIQVSTAVVTDRGFRFSATGDVRLSTLHSSKGLDFPVVMLYLPYLHRHERFDEDTTDRLLRNLVYVGFTRAMETLNVFVCQTGDPVLGDVCRAFAETAETPARV